MFSTFKKQVLLFIVLIISNSMSHTAYKKKNETYLKRDLQMHFVIKTS